MPDTTPTDSRASAASPSDADLMKRVRAGDTAALGWLLNRYWKPLVSYATSLLASADGAEDVAQEAFVRLWERRAGWKGGSVSAYLYQTTRNLSLNERRREQVRASPSPDLEPPRPPTPARLLEQKEIGDALTRALDALPQRRREVFVLARFHDRSYREIADIMGISPQTVANQMSAALAELRRALAGLLGDPPRAP